VLSLLCAYEGEGTSGTAWGQLSGLGGALKKVQAGSGTVHPHTEVICIMPLTQGALCTTRIGTHACAHGTD
jgi:hypothetical protein